MKLDNETINVLKNFTKINTSMVFTGGNVVMINSNDKNVKSIATVPTEFPRRFALYNLDRFIGILSTFDDPELEFAETAVMIKDHNRSIRYTYADERTIVFLDKDIHLSDNYITFTLTEQVIKEVVKASAILAMPNIVFSGDGKNIFIQTTNVENSNGDVYSICIGETNKTFTAVYKTENFKMIPRTYEVTFSSSGVSHYVSPGLEYYIVLEAKHSNF